MIDTVRNHYNPCFWTAHWNPQYYRDAVDGRVDLPNPREQRVHVLSVKANKIYQQPVENVHFDKHLGLAEISREGAAAFICRHRPDEYNAFMQDTDGIYPIYINFEQLVTGMEGLDPYRVLIAAARRGTIVSPEEKAFIAIVIVFQLLRSHAILNSMLQFQDEVGIYKFEHFVTLRWLLMDEQFMYRLVQPMMLSRWTFYRTTVDTFPLCDTPILIEPQDILFALSPRLLLEIDRTTSDPDDRWRDREGIPRHKLAEFRRRTVGNTFREIIFGDSSVLEEWHATRHFKERVVLIRDVKSYNRLVREEGGRELWQLNAYGNR